MNFPIRWVRTAMGDGATETLSLVVIDGCGQPDTLAVQVQRGEGEDGDFEGLYTLDGERMDLPTTWALVERPARGLKKAIRTVEEEWESGLYTLNRIGAQ